MEVPESPLKTASLLVCLLEEEEVSVGGVAMLCLVVLQIFMKLEQKHPAHTQIAPTLGFRQYAHTNNTPMYLRAHANQETQIVHGRTNMQ